MSSNRVSPSANQNWIKDSTLKEFKSQAIKLSAKEKADKEGKRQVTIPHPTSPRAVIIKYI